MNALGGGTTVVWTINQEAEHLSVGPIDSAGALVHTCVGVTYADVPYLHPFEAAYPPTLDWIISWRQSTSSSRFSCSGLEFHSLFGIALPRYSWAWAFRCFSWFWYLQTTGSVCAVARPQCAPLYIWSGLRLDTKWLRKSACRHMHMTFTHGHRNDCGCTPMHTLGDGTKVVWTMNQESTYLLDL